MIKKLLPFVLLINAAHAQITATADRQQGPVGSPFTLTLEAVQDHPIPPADFGPLAADFVLLGQNKTARSNFSSGRSRYTHRWTLTLAPKVTGQLRIPALIIGNERSPVLDFVAVDAVPVAESSPVLVEAEFEDNSVYTHSALLLHVRLLYDAPLAQAELTEPELDQVQVVALGPQHHQTQNRNGRQYQSIEQRYALFPQQPGIYQLPPIRFNGSGPEAPPKGYEQQSQPLDFEALPPPREAAGKQWLPLTEARISRRWTPDTKALQAGDTRTLTVVVEAHGIPAANLPLPRVTKSEGVSLYPQAVRRTQNSDSGILVSRLEWDQEVLFTRQGSVITPEFTLPWWDTVHDRKETARLQPERLEVASFIAQAAPIVKPKPTLTTTVAPEPSSPAAESTGWTSWLWALIALIGTAGWMLTRQRLIQAEQQVQQLTEKLNKQPNPLQRRDYDQEELDAYNALTHACRLNDAELAAKALVQWAKYHWPNKAVGDFSDIELCAQDATLTYLLRHLEHSLYEPDQEDPWQGDLLANQITRLRRRQQRSVA